MNPSYEDFVDQTFSKRYRQLELDIMRDIVQEDIGDHFLC